MSTVAAPPAPPVVAPPPNTAQPAHGRGRTRPRPAARQWTEYPDQPGLFHRPMSWQEYLDDNSEFKVEWIDGEAISMMAPAALWHNNIAANILFLLRTQLPGCTVVGESGLKFIRGVRVPDVLVTEEPVTPKTVWSLTPLILVEVLSKSTRKQDIVTKAAEYLKVGVAQYWIADPLNYWLEIKENRHGAWQTVAILDGDHPEISVSVPNHGTIKLTLDRVFA